MFAYGIAEPWNKIEGKELEVVRRAIHDSIDGNDVRRLNLDRIDRGPTPFYGRETGDDDRTASVRLYRVDVHNENTDMYCLVFLPIGWATETNDPHGPPQAQEAHAQQRPRVTLIPLDKTSSPIHEMNQKHKPLLFDNSKSELSKHDEHNVLHYLRFFCEFVHGGNPESTSPFYIIDSSHEVTINPDGIESIRLARESQGPSPSADHRTIDQSAGANTDAKTGNDAVPLTAKPHEEATKSIDNNAKILDQPIKPRWVLDPERPSELIGIKDSRAVVEARVVYGKVGYTARFFVHSSGMIEMSADLPELADGTVAVLSPRELFIPEMRYDTHHAHTMSHQMFHAILRGELPPNLPPCVSIRDGVVEIRDVDIINDKSTHQESLDHEQSHNDIDPHIGTRISNAAPHESNATTSCHRHSKSDISVIRAIECTYNGEINLNRRKLEHEIQFIDVIAESFNADGAVFESFLSFVNCSFVGKKILRRKELDTANHGKDTCAIRITGASFTSDVRITNCLACTKHVRTGQRSVRPLLALETDRPSVQLDLSGSRSKSDLFIVNSALWGKVNFSRACIDVLWCHNCSIIGDLELSWMSAKIITIENQPSTDKNPEAARIHAAGSRRRFIISERCGVAGHVLIGGTKIEKNLMIKGVLIADSLMIWQSEMLNIDLGPQKGIGTSSRTRICGAVSITDSIVHTSASFQGLKVTERGYKRAASLAVKFSGSDHFDTMQWPSLNRHGEPRLQPGWKLSDDGRIAIRDSRIGFDLAIAGIAARRNAPLWQRLSLNQSAESDNGIELEGLEIGGDLDFRGYKTKRDIRIENVRIAGHVRAGIQTLVRELHDQSIVDNKPEAVINVDSSTANLSNEVSPTMLWTTLKEAYHILTESRTQCRNFYIRTSRVTGDMRLDGLTAHATENLQHQSAIDDNGCVTIQSCHIDGDISFILTDGLSGRLFENIFNSDDIAKKRDENLNYINKSNIQSGLDLTNSICGYFIISKFCFRELAANDAKKTLVYFNKFKTARFTLIDGIIDRGCDFDSIEVGLWAINKETSPERLWSSNHRHQPINNQSLVDIELLKEFLAKDAASPRNTYASVERLFLSHGEMDYAEKIRKQLWHKMAAKDVKKIRTWPKFLFRKIAAVYGYGGTVSLLSPALLFIAIAVGLSFYVCLGVPTLAFEPSLLCSIAGSDSTIPAADTSAIGYADAVLLAARSTLPGLGLLIADDLRPASTPLPYCGSISMSHIMDFVSIFGWICWALTAIVISMRIFRSAGLR